jgi:uncharacterized membrane protein
MAEIEARKSSRSVAWGAAISLSVGLLLIGWLLNTPPGLLGKADAIGYAVCHRIDARSFHLGERQLPLCVRCTGMYLGAVLGLALQALLRPRRGGMPGIATWVVLTLFALAFAIDGLNSYMHLLPGLPTLYEPQHWLRLLTGTGMGLAIAIVLFPAYNQTVWVEWDRHPAIESLKLLGILIASAVLLDLIVLTENPLVLYPLALVSAAGVLIVLTMVYTLVTVLVMRMENRFQTVSQLALPLVCGFGIGLLQIAALDFIRFLFTGSWDGFHLG